MKVKGKLFAWFSHVPPLSLRTDEKERRVSCILTLQLILGDDERAKRNYKHKHTFVVFTMYTQKQVEWPILWVYIKQNIFVESYMCTQRDHKARLLKQKPQVSERTKCHRVTQCEPDQRKYRFKEQSGQARKRKKCRRSTTAVQGVQQLWVVKEKWGQCRAK